MRGIPREHFRADGKAKVAYETKRLADTFIASRKGGFHSYKCSICGKFHVASQPGRRLYPAMMGDKYGRKASKRIKRENQTPIGPGPKIIRPNPDLRLFYD